MSLIEELRARTAPLTVKQVADLLDVSPATIQRWVRHGELPAIRISDTIRLDPSTLADRLERSLVEPNEATEGIGIDGPHPNPQTPSMRTT
jgi:excisionase family DNA binding protein